MFREKEVKGHELANIVAERGDWGDRAIGLCCRTARRKSCAAKAAAASVADVETVHKKDRPACWHTRGRQGQIT